MHRGARPPRPTALSSFDRFRCRTLPFAEAARGCRSGSGARRRDEESLSSVGLFEPPEEALAFRLEAWPVRLAAATVFHRVCRLEAAPTADLLWAGRRRSERRRGASICARRNLRPRRAARFASLCQALPQ